MIKLTTVANMREADKKAISGNEFSALNLMDRAASALYDELREDGKIAIICGVGNNGGDGFALAFLMSKDKRKVTVFYVGEPKTPEAVANYLKCKGERSYIELVHIESQVSTLNFSEFDTIYDCLLGTGARFLDEGIILETVKSINSSGAFVISCDINSGLDGDSGLINGETAVKSNLTLSIGNIKTGLVQHDALDYIGKLKNVDIGVILDSDIYAVEDCDIKECFPKRKSHTHKGSYGKCGIYGGSEEYSGSVKLANLAQCSLRVGVGLCKVILTPTLFPIIAPFLLESTVAMVDEKGDNYDYMKLDNAIDGLDSLLFGVGAGNNIFNLSILKYLLSNFDGWLVIDADGLNAIAKEPSILKNVKSKVVLTPHIKEMERLTGIAVLDIKKNAIEIARHFALEYDVIVVLKDNSTIITDGTTTYISSSGSPAMAKGGSGDVLAGAIVGKLASKEGSDNDLLSIAATTYLVGKAGQYASMTYGEYAALPSDTVEHLGVVIKNLYV